MLFTSTGQWVALALVFIGGWLLGLASHPGGRRWRDRYTAERDAHAALRRDHQTVLTERERVADTPVAAAPVVERPIAAAPVVTTAPDHETRLAEAQRRIAELERDNAKLAKAAPVTAATIAPATTSSAVAAPVVRPEPGGTSAYPQRVTASPVSSTDGDRRV